MPPPTVARNESETDGRMMHADFVTFTVVGEPDWLSVLFGVPNAGIASTKSRTVRASDEVGYESLDSREHHDRPNARVRLNGGEFLHVKEHVSTVAQQLKVVPQQT